MSKKCVNGCDGIVTGCSKCPKNVITIERTVPDLSYEIVEGQLKHIQGQILTLVEAIVPVKEQRESAKMLVKGFINDKLTLLFDMYGPVERETPDYSGPDSLKE